MSVYERALKKTENGESFLLIAVGDSITWGLNHCTADETYCGVLARLFAENLPNAVVERFDGIVSDVDGEKKPLDGYSAPIKVKNGNGGTFSLVRSGVGGNTVLRAINRFVDYSGIFQNGEYPDAFLLMFGINDSLLNDSSKYASPEDFYENYNTLCDMLEKSNPSAEIVLMTPTYNDLGDGRESSLDIYSEKVKFIAEKRGYKCIDLHSLWMTHLTVGGNNYGQGDWLSGVEGDYCHFSVIGAAETAKYVFEELKK